MSACGTSADPTVCKPVGENYLQDADFKKEQQNPRSNNWITLQHAGEPSFEFTINKGELTIRKIGTQPWGVFRQQLRNIDLGGERMAFSAELKFDLDPTAYTTYNPGGGLSLTAHSGRNRIVLQSTFNHEPKLGHTEWIPVQVIVDIPGNTQSIQLDFLHQAEGILQVRNPSFHRVDTSSPACAVTPETDNAGGTRSQL